MDENVKEKELTEAVVEAIFNGIPVVLDCNGIEAFNSFDVFTFLRNCDLDGEFGNEYFQKFFEIASEYSDDDLNARIRIILDAFVKIGIFQFVPGSEYGEFDPLGLAYDFRAFFISGEFPYEDTNWKVSTEKKEK